MAARANGATAAQGGMGWAEGCTEGCRDVWLQAAEMELHQVHNRDYLPPSEGIWGQDIRGPAVCSSWLPPEQDSISSLLGSHQETFVLLLSLFSQVRGRFSYPEAMMSCLDQVHPRQKQRQEAQGDVFSPTLCSQMQLTGFGWSLHLHFGSWDPIGFAPFTPQTQIQGIVF